MAKNNNQMYVIGGALAAGLASTLAYFMWPEKRSSSVFNKVKDFAEDTMTSLSERHNFHRNFMIGSVAGSIIAATTALLLAPKSGKEMMQDIADQFHHNGERRIPKPKRHSQSQIVRASPASKSFSKARKTVTARPARKKYKKFEG